MSLNLLIRQLMYREISRMQRSVRYSLVFALVLFSTQLVRDDVLGKFLMYNVDQDSGKISETEYGKTTMSISKDSNGSYNVVRTVEVSEEEWKQQLAEEKSRLEKLSVEEKQHIEQYAAVASGGEPSDGEGAFDEVGEGWSDRNHEDEAKTVETTTEVNVDGNNVSIFFPILGYREMGILNTDSKKEIGMSYEIVIENGELKGTCTFLHGSVSPPHTVKVHGKLITDSPSSEEESVDTATDDTEILG